MKKAALIVICLVLVFAFSGCKRKAQPGAQTPTPTPVVQPQDSLPIIDIKSDVARISISPNYQTLALQTKSEDGIDAKIILFSMETRKVVATATVDISMNDRIQWSPDSKRLVAAGTYPKPGEGQIVVMEATGKVRHFETAKGLGDAQFRAKESSKIVFVSGDAIREIDIPTGRQTKLAGVPKGFLGLVHFRGYDCCAERDAGTDIHHPGNLRVRSVDSGRMLFSMTLGDMRWDSYHIDFSPDSRWFALWRQASASTPLLIGSVKHADMVMRYPYVSSYNRHAVDTNLGVQWRPETSPGDYQSDALVIDEWNTATAINLKSGAVQLWEYPHTMTWWREKPGEENIMIVSRHAGLYIGVIAGPYGGMILDEMPESVQLSSGMGMIARFRKQGQLVTAQPDDQPGQEAQ